MDISEKRAIDFARRLGEIRARMDRDEYPKTHETKRAYYDIAVLHDDLMWAIRGDRPGPVVAVAANDAARREIGVRSTGMVIQEAQTMAMDAAFVARLGGGRVFRLYRRAKDEWVAEFSDPAKPVRNEDERLYTHPRHLKGFVEGRLNPDECASLSWKRVNVYDGM